MNSELDFKTYKHEDGSELKTMVRTFYDCNTLQAEAGSQPWSGDSVISRFTIDDKGGTNWEINSGYDGLEVILHGEAERRTMIAALRFIANVLESYA